MVEKLLRYRALVGMNLDGVRVEAGQLIPPKLVEFIPEVWFTVKVEEA